MPKYDFKCVKCQKVEERIVLYKETDKQICNCGGRMRVLFNMSVSFQVRWGKPKVRQKVKRMGA